MKIYYYAHTGHRIGLDRFRRASAIINLLQEEGIDITLLSSDYRIASVARDYGINKAVGIDVVRNIANIAENGDKLIFDSEEANPYMLEDMRGYFSSFIRISDKKDDKKENNELLISPYLEGDGVLKTIVVDDKYFNEFEKDVEISYFFGDDDYEKDLEKHFDFIEGLDVALGLGFYYFLDYEEMLKDKFKKTFEFEEYDEMITKSKILITASPQAVLESLASGSNPIYFQREDYTTDFIELFENLNVPVIYNYDRDKLDEIIKNIADNDYIGIERKSNILKKFIINGLNL